jgi:ribosome biogenesis GTPase A
VQWYPGHIAKAERRLREQLSMVDVVLEVRDARCSHSLQALPSHNPPQQVLRDALSGIQNRISMVAALTSTCHACCYACRIPQSTTHPSVPKWCGAKPRLLLLNRVDMVSEGDRRAWTRHLSAQGCPPLWTDGVSGLGSGQVRLLPARAYSPMGHPPAPSAMLAFQTPLLQCC